jgi:hypothetical protein
MSSYLGSIEDASVITNHGWIPDTVETGKNPKPLIDFTNDPGIVTPLSPEEEKALAPLYEKKSALPVVLAAGAALLLFA